MQIAMLPKLVETIAADMLEAALDDYRRVFGIKPPPKSEKPEERNDADGADPFAIRAEYPKPAR